MTKESVYQTLDPRGESVGAIISNSNGQVLLVKRKDNDSFIPSVWEIPGGGVDPGETLQQAVEREVAEETGLSLSAEGYSVVNTCTYGDTVQYNYHLPLCLSNPTITLTEHSEYAWVSISDLGEYFPPGDMILNVLVEWASTL
jgi:8-oxo-dGTP diphosphatase